MKSSITIATFLLAGAGAAGVGAIAPIETPLQGSDTLFNITQDAITALSGLGSDIGPASSYVGGGSGNGQSALVGKTQHIAPMSRMINNGACTSDLVNASGVVIGLDGVDVLASDQQGGNPATCNSANNGLAFDGTNGQGFTNYKQVLALVYGGKDPTGTVNCAATLADGVTASPRAKIVNNWSALFENSCANGEASCSDAAHQAVCATSGVACVGVGNGNCAAGTGPCVPKLWHAFRRDDASGTSDVYATILGITPNTSASSLNGFGASPYCNALNWDAATANANCAAGAGKQFIGPGGVRQGFCSVTTATSCVIGAAHCDANSGTLAGMRCPGPAPVVNQCNSSNPLGLCVVDNAPCPAGEVCQPLAGDNHRRPPLNTWGDDPDPSNPRGDADVLPTSMQDNDPIRRPVIGTTVHNARAGEELGNRDSTLGVVLPIPALDFITTLADPTHAGNNLVAYPMNSCNNFVFGTAPRVLNCALRNTAVHTGECPSGDQTFGASHTCVVPIDATNSTSQCQQAKTATIAVKTRVPAVNSADLRVYNLHMRDGTVTDGSIAYVHETIPTATATLSLDMAGAFARLHQVQTIPLGLGGCTLLDATDQIGCFVHADRCSIGYGGDGATTFAQRYANGTCSGGGALCATFPKNSNPCSYFSGGSGTCTVGAPVTGIAPMLVNKVAPSTQTVQLLGDGPVEYPLARKLYLNSFNFHQGVDSAGNPTDAGFEAGLTLAELTLAKFESTVGDDAGPPPNGIAPILVNRGFFTLGPNSPTGADTPFCEDFNQALVCDAGGFVNDNACARNPPQWVPTDTSAVPDAAVFSTVCGNGVVEIFEECDPAADPTTWTCSVPGATVCSSTCRC